MKKAIETEIKGIVKDILADYVDELCVYKDYGKVGFKISKIGDKAPKLGAALRLINDFIANI